MHWLYTLALALKNGQHILLKQRGFMMRTTAKTLQQQVIWITGASSGIGQALAIRAAELGASVILSSPDAQGLEQTYQSCQRFSDNHLILPLDVLDEAACEQAYKTILEKYKQLDWLINNAGITHRSTVIETSNQIDDQIFNLDYRAPTRLTRMVLPEWVKRKQGRLVMMSSIVGLVGTQHRASYGAAKAALHLWANSLRSEVAQQGIRVQVVFPGFVKTNITQHALTPSGEAYGKMGDGQANAMSAEQFSALTWNKLLSKRNYIVIGDLKERAAVFISKFAPEIFYKIIAKVEVR
jgi:short-subunit dehydrogenase